MTIRDVAAAAGVSITTVSHTISGSRSVTLKTAEKVWNVVRQLGYLPNSSAQRLRKGTTNSLGLVIPDMGNFFYTQLATTIHRFALTCDFQLLIRNTQEIQEEEERAVEQLLARHLVDGVIVVPTFGPHSYIEGLVKSGAKIIVLNRRLKDTRAPIVRGNNEEAAYTLANHLLNLGHRRVGAIVSRQGIITGDERLAGFRRAMDERGLKDALIVWRQGSETQSSQRCEGYEATKLLLRTKERPTAILAASFQFAEGVIMALRDLCIPCPQSAALAAFGSAWPAQVMTPRLTVMQQDFDRMGVVATQLLISWIETGVVTEKDVLVDCQFFVGESCGWKLKDAGESDASTYSDLQSITDTQCCPCDYRFCPYQLHCRKRSTYHKENSLHSERLT